MWEPRRVGGHRDMATSQCDVAQSFCTLFGEFGPLELVPRRVGCPTRHGDLPMRRGHSFSSLSGGFGPLGLVPRRVGGPSRHCDLPIRRGALVLLSFGGIRTLGARATSRWRPIATWRPPNTTWRTRFAPFRGDSDPWGSCHVALKAHRDMAGAQYDVARSFYSLLGGFGPLELVPRRIGGPSRHGALPMRRGALVLLYFGAFRRL